VLTVDGCPVRDGDFFPDLCMEKNAIPILPHSSNQVQTIDLTIFGVTQRLITRLNKMEPRNVQSNHITKFVSAFHSAVNPIHVIASFQNAGLTSRLGPDGLATCYVDIDQCRCVLNSAEVIAAVAPDGCRQDTGNPPTNWTRSKMSIC
jgi:hypothetical protein